MDQKCREILEKELLERGESRIDWVIRLEGGDYLADGMGRCLVERCSFTEVCTDREDLELFRCEELRGKLLRRTRVYDMVDRESCSGLEAIEQLIPGTD